MGKSRGVAYTCSGCGKQGERHHMITHFIKSHVPKEQAPWHCALCGYKALQYKDMERHKDSFSEHLRLASLEVQPVNHEKFFTAAAKKYMVVEGTDIVKMPPNESLEFWATRPQRNTANKRSSTAMEGPVAKIPKTEIKEEKQKKNPLQALWEDLRVTDDESDLDDILNLHVSEEEAEIFQKEEEDSRATHRLSQFEPLVNEMRLIRLELAQFNSTFLGMASAVQQMATSVAQLTSTLAAKPTAQPQIVRLLNNGTQTGRVADKRGEAEARELVQTLKSREKKMTGNIGARLQKFEKLQEKENKKLD